MKFINNITIVVFLGLGTLFTCAADPSSAILMIENNQKKGSSRIKEFFSNLFERCSNLTPDIKDWQKNWMNSATAKIENVKHGKKALANHISKNCTKVKSYTYDQISINFYTILAGIVTGVAYESGLINKLASSVKKGSRRLYSFVKHNKGNVAIATGSFISAQIALCLALYYFKPEVAESILSSTDSGISSLKSGLISLVSTKELMVKNTLLSAFLYAATVGSVIGINRVTK